MFKEKLLLFFSAFGCNFVCISCLESRYAFWDGDKKRQPRAQLLNELVLEWQSLRISTWYCNKYLIWYSVSWSWKYPSWYRSLPEGSSELSLEERVRLNQTKKWVKDVPGRVARLGNHKYSSTTIARDGAGEKCKTLWAMRSSLHMFPKVTWGSLKILLSFDCAEMTSWPHGGWGWNGDHVGWSLPEMEGVLVKVKQRTGSFRRC